MIDGHYDEPEAGPLTTLILLALLVGGPIMLHKKAGLGIWVSIGISVGVVIALAYLWAWLRKATRKENP